MYRNEKLLLEAYIQQEIKHVLLEQGVTQQLKQGVANVSQKAIQALLSQFDGLVKKVEAYKGNKDISEIYRAINQAGVQIKLPKELAPFQTTLQQWSNAATNLKEHNVKFSNKHNFLLKEASRSFKEANKLLEKNKRLDELADPITIIGVVLAGLKAVSLMGIGLEKLGAWLKKSNSTFMQTVGGFCLWLGHLFHYAHKAEQKTVDLFVPDKLSYAIYKYYWNNGKGEDLHKKLFRGKDPKTLAQLEKLKSKEQASLAAHMENPEADAEAVKAKGGSNRFLAALSYEEWQQDQLIKPKLEELVFHVYILILFISALPTVYHILHGFVSHGISGAVAGAHGSTVLAAAEPAAATIKAGELATASARAGAVAAEIGVGLLRV